MEIYSLIRADTPDSISCTSMPGSYLSSTWLLPVIYPAPTYLSSTWLLYRSPTRLLLVSNPSPTWFLTFCFLSTSFLQHHPPCPVSRRPPAWPICVFYISPVSLLCAFPRPTYMSAYLLPVLILCRCLSSTSAYILPVLIFYQCPSLLPYNLLSLTFLLSYTVV